MNEYCWAVVKMKTEEECSKRNIPQPDSIFGVYDRERDANNDAYNMNFLPYKFAVCIPSQPKLYYVIKLRKRGNHMRIIEEPINMNRVKKTAESARDFAFFAVFVHILSAFAHGMGWM